MDTIYDISVKVIALIVMGGLALLTVALVAFLGWVLFFEKVLPWLRSRRKRPEPQEAGLDDKRYALLDGAVVRLREVYPGDYKLFRLTNLSHPLHWDEIEPSPPSSPATETTEATPPWSDAG